MTDESKIKCAWCFPTPCPRDMAMRTKIPMVEVKDGKTKVVPEKAVEIPTCMIHLPFFAQGLIAAEVSEAGGRLQTNWPLIDQVMRISRACRASDVMLKAEQEQKDRIAGVSISAKKEEKKDDQTKD